MRAQFFTRSLWLLAWMPSCTKAEKTMDAEPISSDSSASSDTQDVATDDTGTDPATPTPPGPCLDWAEPQIRATVADPTLDEISGMVMSRLNPGVIWVHEDSGSEPVLTALSTDGVTVATVTLTDVSSIDWEDMALAPCGDTDCLWIGDFGDNGNARTDIQLLRIEEPTLTGAEAALNASPSVFPFRYPEGPQDAEAMVVDGSGQPFVLTKRTDTTSRIYRVPIDGSGVATRVSTVTIGEVEGLPTAVTAADFWPNANRLLIRAYLQTIELQLGDTGIAGAETASSTPIITGLDPQGEAIAYDPNGPSIWHVSEGINPSLWVISCADE